MLYLYDFELYKTQNNPQKTREDGLQNLGLIFIGCMKYLDIIFQNKLVRCCPETSANFQEKKLLGIHLRIAASVENLQVLKYALSLAMYMKNAVSPSPFKTSSQDVFHNKGVPKRFRKTHRKLYMPASFFQ